MNGMERMFVLKAPKSMVVDQYGPCPDPRAAAPQMMKAIPQPVSNSGEERFDRVAWRIEKLEMTIAKLERIVNSLPLAFVEVGQHLARIDENFKTVQVVANALHTWAVTFLDEYNERHQDQPLMYPAELPKAFALPGGVTNTANARMQELLNENAMLRMEYDAIQAKFADAARARDASRKVAAELGDKIAELEKPTEAGRIREMQEDLNVSIKERNAAEAKVAELEDQIAKSKKRKPVKKKPAAK